MKLLPALILVAAPAFLPAHAEVPAAGDTAFFGLHFIDLSTEGAMNGIRADETARVEMTEGVIADDLTARGFTLLPLDPVAAELAKVANPAACNGCDVKLAHELGADYALTGEVRKISNLILSFSLHLRDAKTGAVLRTGAVDIRGNTDESWQRGMRYLLKNIIFRDR
ncbi:MAG: DUF3280 domain-containing protein [Paracoccaceae bacterium]